MQKILSYLLQVACPTFFLGMQGSALQTALEVIANKSVNLLSPLPFVSLFVNCIVWSMYGILRGDNTVLIPNLIGIFVGFFCSLSYQRFAKSTPRGLYIVSLFLILLALKFSLSGDFKSVGLLGCSLAVVVSGSPLVTTNNYISSCYRFQ